MNTLRTAFGLIPLLIGGSLAQASQESQQAWGRFQSQAASALEAAQRSGPRVAPLPEGVAELRFQDFFKPVVGDRGLEYSETLLKLDGKRVRVSGFMVREQNRPSGVFMLAPWPTRVENDGFCVYEDFPPATLHVLPASPSSEVVPFRPGLLVLTGRISVKPAPMPDGRNCVLSLTLDPEVSPAVVLAE